MPGGKRILYVDGDAEARLMMRDLLSNYEIDVAATEEEARTHVHVRNYDLYILAGGGPASTGIALCAWLQRVDGRTPIVFCSSNLTSTFQQAAIAAGAVRYLAKPLDPTLLRSTVNLLLKLAELETARALAASQQAVDHELARTRDAVRRTSRDKVQRALECVLRAKAYRAFRAAGGNRANFERHWPASFQRQQRPDH